MTKTVTAEEVLATALGRLQGLVGTPSYQQAVSVLITNQSDLIQVVQRQQEDIDTIVTVLNHLGHGGRAEVTREATHLL